jgi:hypothetical protein
MTRTILIAAIAVLALAGCAERKSIPPYSSEGSERGPLNLPNSRLEYPMGPVEFCDKGECWK